MFRFVVALLLVVRVVVVFAVVLFRVQIGAKLPKQGPIFN
jgi:hypothetical protein